MHIEWLSGNTLKDVPESSTVICRRESRSCTTTTRKTRQCHPRRRQTGMKSTRNSSSSTTTKKDSVMKKADILGIQWFHKPKVPTTHPKHQSCPLPIQNMRGIYLDHPRSSLNTNVDGTTLKVNIDPDS